jgi:hypothetical protein
VRVYRISELYFILLFFASSKSNRKTLLITNVPYMMQESKSNLSRAGECFSGRSRPEVGIDTPNRSNARHRSNIRAHPRPPPPRIMHLKFGNLCGQRGRKRFIASWGIWMSHICPCTPCPSPPRVEVKGRNSSFCPPLEQTHQNK